MGNLVEFAKSELKRIEDKCDEEGLPWQKLIDENILAVVAAFETGEHSGFSASYALNMIENLLRWKPLTALTGEEDEWNKLDYGSDPVYQNKRCSAVFKDEDGRAYYVEGKAFSDDGGRSWYTNKNSHINIEFPFIVPTHVERVDLTNYEERNDIRKSIYERLDFLVGISDSLAFEDFDENKKIIDYIEADKLKQLEDMIVEIHQLVEIDGNGIQADDHIYHIISKIQNSYKIGSDRDVFRRISLEGEDYSLVFNTGRKEIIEISKYIRHNVGTPEEAVSIDEVYNARTMADMSLEAFKVAQFADAERVFEKEMNEKPIKENNDGL